MQIANLFIKFNQYFCCIKYKKGVICKYRKGERYGEKK